MSDNVQCLNETVPARRNVWPIGLAAVFLIASTSISVKLLESYEYHLTRSGMFAASVRLTHDSELYLPLFSATQFLVVSLFLRFPSLFTPWSWIKRWNRFVYRDVAVGALAGIAMSLLSVPTLLLGGQSSLALFLVNHFFDGVGIASFVVIVVVLPLASELLFRKIMFQQLSESLSWVSALILSTVLFAIVWPMFNPVAAVILSSGAALLFRRTRSLLACVMANSIFTLCVLALLVVRQLYWP